MENIKEVENRIKYFLIDNPGSLALKISKAVGVSRQKVQAIMARANGVVVTQQEGTGFSCYSLAPLGAIEASALDRNQPPSLDACIDSLKPLVKKTIIGQIEDILGGIVGQEVDTAMEAIQLRVKSRLAFMLNGGNLVEHRHTPVAVKAPVVTPKLPPAPGSINFSNPEGAPVVTHDTISKRTAHKFKGDHEQKSSVDTAPEKVSSRKKPKVIIVGIQTKLQEIVKREFREKFDLRMFNADQFTYIQKAINPGDDVICMADFIGHRHSDMVTAEGGKMDVVHGGVPTLRAALIERLDANREKAA